MFRQEPRTSTLSAARFEEIFQSVVSKNMQEMDKDDDDDKEMNHMPVNQMNSQHPQQHIIVSGAHQIPHQQQIVIAQPSQGNVYHQQQDGQTYAIYQPPQSQAQNVQQQQRIIVQQV